MGSSPASSPPRLELVGGPYDGLTVGYRPDPFVHVFGPHDAPRGSVTPGPGRVLYRARDGRLEVAGNHYAVCPACEGITASGSACRGCGEPLARAPTTS